MCRATQNLRITTQISFLTKKFESEILLLQRPYTPNKVSNNFIIAAPGFGPLTIIDGIPAALSGYVIPGSKAFSAEADFGSFLLQLVELDGFSWIYSVCDIEKNVTFFISSPDSLSALHIVLTGNYEQSIKEIGDIVLTENEFRLFFFADLNSNTFLKKNKRYTAIDIFYPVDFLLHTLSFYPAFDEFANNIRQAKTSSIPPRSVFINAIIMEWLYQLIHSPFSPSVRSFHLNIIRNILPAVLAEASIINPGRHTMEMQQLEIIYAAKEFIDTHLSEHFSILDIAKRVGINKQDLKTKFKKIFGKGLFEYLLTTRLVIARINLEETFKPVKDIARSAGYKSPGNFSTAFRKKFGKSPMAWRQDYRTKNNHCL